ncbi:hypothetical protein BsWGS_28668 [Bradybaena similaris]
MVAPCTFKVGLALWVLLPRFQMTLAADHPPVLEGKNLVFTCSGHSESTQRRSLYWMTTDPGGQSVNQAICHSTKPSCRNYNNFVATASFTGKDYTTSFTIPAMSNNAFFVTVNCTLYEEERDSSYVIKSWNESDLVHPPVNPRCAAVYNVEEATVAVSCSTPKAFPAIVCKFFEVHDNGKEVPLTTAEIKYGYPASNTIACQCSLIKPISKPGIHKYKVDLYPGLPDSDLLKEAATTVYTNEISVAGKPEVHIKSIPVCKNNNIQGFVCTAHWLPSQANLVWYKNTTLISNTTTTTAHVGSGFFTSESSVELENLHSYNGPIYCQANYRADGRVGNKTISAQLLVDTNVSSLHFTYNGVLLGNKLILKEKKAPGKFECRVVNGNKPPINAVEVVCKISDNVQNFTLVAESVAFDLPPVTPGNVGICYCSVTRNNGCDQSKVNFTFSFGHAEYSRSTFQRQWQGSYINNIYYITAGCIGLILLVFFLGTVMFLVSKWDKLYTYVYGKLYAPSHGRSTSVNGAHWYYSVASSVQTRLPCGETSPDTDRTSITASPDSIHSQHVYSNVDGDSDEEVTTCTDWLATLYPPKEETNEYSNLTNGVVFKPAPTQPVTVADTVRGKPIKCNGFSQRSDLVGILHKYSRNSPPKPCKPHNCPDLLLHRPSLIRGISTSDDEQPFRITQESVATEEYVAVF